MIRAIFDPIMNSSKNGLRHLPKIVRFQLMTVLATFWSMIFCVSAGIVAWLPEYVAVHVVLLLIGIFGTGWLFKSAQAKSVPLPAATEP
jgi:hypothetical protein